LSAAVENVGLVDVPATRNTKNVGVMPTQPESLQATASGAQAKMPV